MRLKNRFIQKIGIFLIGIFLIGIFSCKKNSEVENNELETTTTIASKKGMNLANLLGTWQHADQQFSLYNDGSVAQQNMKELELMDWTLEEEELVFSRKNSEGKQTEMNQERYKILELTTEELTLEKKGDTITFKK